MALAHTVRDRPPPPDQNGTNLLEKDAKTVYYRRQSSVASEQQPDQHRFYERVQALKEARPDELMEQEDEPGLGNGVLVGSRPVS